MRHNLNGGPLLAVVGKLRFAILVAATGMFLFGYGWRAGPPFATIIKNKIETNMQIKQYKNKAVVSRWGGCHQKGWPFVLP